MLDVDFSGWSLHGEYVWKFTRTKSCWHCQLFTTARLRIDLRIKWYFGCRRALLLVTSLDFIRQIKVARIVKFTDQRILAGFALLVGWSGQHYIFSLRLVLSHPIFRFRLIVNYVLILLTRVLWLNQYYAAFLALDLVWHLKLIRLARC